MIKSKVLLVRHAQAVVSDEAPPGAWPLSEAGSHAAEALGHRLAIRFDREIEAVVASSERKAIETAARLQNRPPVVDERLGEVAKPWYPDAADHEAAAIRYLRGTELAGWEHQDAAVQRFGAAIVSCAERFVVVATHGTVMSLWLAATLDDFDPVAFWLSLKMPDAYLFEFGAKSTLTAL